jgi:hypothetical protein
MSYPAAGCDVGVLSGGIRGSLPQLRSPSMTIRFCDDLGRHGFSWIVEEAMTRTSHALATTEGVWLVDPVDWPDAIDRATSLGPPAGVIQLLDRHNRDAAALAERLDVPHLMVPSALPGTPFEIVEIKRSKRWQEVALWWPEPRVLVVGEALGTNPFFTIGGDAVGVHPFLKLTPPRQLAAYEPDHLLFGHGEGVHKPEATIALREALDRSRLTAVRWAATLPFRMVKSRR